MLHDIILALGGVGGGVLKSILNEEIVSLSSFAFHPCERNILAQLISIADNYKTIENFLKKVPHFGDEQIVLDNGVEIPPGMYLRAFCNGMYDCLEPYRKNLVKVEKETLQDPHQTASGILAQVAPYKPLLTALNSVTKQIATRHLHGCKLLQLLHQHLSSGIEMVDEAMARIMQCCHLVMLKQLTSFLLYGQLIDTYKEFFIQECSTAEDLYNASTSTLDSQSQPESIGDSQREKSPEYEILQDMVPCYIPSSVPEKTKFIGTTVVILSRDPRTEKTGIRKYYSLYEKTENTLLSQLKALQNVSALDLSSMLETVIDDIESCVTQHLFSLAKDDANMREELQLIKDYFLLGRGELFVVFLRKASGILKKPVVNNRASQELNNLLHMSVRNVHLNSDLIANKFSFKVPLKDKAPMAQPNTIVWRQMILQYQPPWPLHLLFIPKQMETYNRLFSFLLQVKWAELNLHNVWMKNVKQKDNMLPASIWTLRNNLQHLIGNLQCYLHLDVIESQFSRLCTALDQTHDFREVAHHHSMFLTNVASECFIENTHTLEGQPRQNLPVNRCLMKILTHCDDFCEEVDREKVREKVIEKITSGLQSEIGVLMNLISMMGNNKGSGLRLLLLRLDYNRFFSSQVLGETI